MTWYLQEVHFINVTAKCTQNWDALAILVYALASLVIRITDLSIQFEDENEYIALLLSVWHHIVIKHNGPSPLPKKLQNWASYLWMLYLHEGPIEKHFVMKEQ